MKKILIFSIAIFAFLQNASAQITISAARSTTLGSTVTVRGIVTNGSELGVIRYMQDGTAGIAAYSATMSTVNAGDSVQVTGVLKNYNQLLEIDPVTSFSVITTGNPMPAAKIVLIGAAFSEPYESQIVKINAVTFSNSGNFSGNTNYNISNGGTTKALRVVTGVNLVGSPIPGTPVGVSGIMSQFDFANPNNGYQLLPRGFTDITFGGGPVITVAPSPRVTSITTNSMIIEFATQNPGSSLIFWGTVRSNLATVAKNVPLVTTHAVSLTGLTPATIYYFRAASIDANGDTSFSGIQTGVTKSLSTGAMQVYFNRPVDNTVANSVNNHAVYLNRAIDDTLIAFLSRAKYTVDISIYNWNNSQLSDISAMVNQLYSRVTNPVKIRIVFDASSANLGLNSLNGNIPRIGRVTTTGIMHNKFVVVDAESSNPNDAYVWSGSTNWTDGNINSDANNVVIIQDQSLAKAYKLEFEEMFGSETNIPNPANAKFGSDKINNTPQNIILGNGKHVELYFSPSDETETAIVRAIKSANKDIELALMLITRTTLAYEVENKIKAGMYGAGIISDTSASGTAPFNIMRNASTASATRFRKNTTGILHSKYMIVDQNANSSDPLVLTGSHNWSSSANTINDENTLIIHDKDIANLYFQDWVQRFKDAGGSPNDYYTGVMQNAKNNLNIDIYPNPGRDILNFSSDLLRTNKATVSILDVTGKVISTTTLLQQNTMNISHLNNGIYFVKVSIANHGEQTIRLVKAN